MPNTYLSAAIAILQEVEATQSPAIATGAQWIADAIETAGMRPDVNFAMAAMHMDGVTPPLALVEAGVWRAKVKLPMAGRWIVSVGFGEEFAEVEFDAR